MANENEHLEHIQSWWQRYQFYVAGSILMLLTAIGGFTYTNADFQEQKVASNALLFELITNASEEQDLAAAQATYDSLAAKSGFDDLQILSSFALASIQIAQGDVDDAAETLAATHAAAEDPYVRAASAVRLAEALMLKEEYDEALEVLEAEASGALVLRNLMNERMGDIEFIRGNHTAALEFYSAALQTTEQSSAFYVPMLRIKISALLSHIRDNDLTTSGDWQSNTEEQEASSSETSGE